MGCCRAVKGGIGLEMPMAAAGTGGRYRRLVDNLNLNDTIALACIRHRLEEF